MTNILLVIIIYPILLCPLPPYREWYSYHFPELIRIIPDNNLYAKVRDLIMNTIPYFISDTHTHTLSSLPLPPLSSLPLLSPPSLPLLSPPSPSSLPPSKVVRFIGSRKNLTEDKLEELEEIVMDSTKTQAIFEAAKMSMGMDISAIDLINIERFAIRVIELADYRRQLAEYLTEKMGSVAPNLTTLIGEQVSVVY